MAQKERRYNKAVKSMDEFIETLKSVHPNLKVYIGIADEETNRVRTYANCKGEHLCAMLDNSHPTSDDLLALTGIVKTLTDIRLKNSSGAENIKIVHGVEKHLPN